MCTSYYRGQWVGYDEAPQAMPSNDTEEEEVFVDTYSVYEEYLEEKKQMEQHNRRALC